MIRLFRSFDCRRRFALVLLMVLAMPASGSMQPRSGFHLEEATIAHIQQALLGKRVTTVGLVELYLRRIKAYNGTCVNEPQGILGPITTIPRAGQLNALATLNLRPADAQGLGLRRSQGAQPDRRRRRRPGHARRARGGRRAGSAVHADRHGWSARCTAS